MKDGWPRAILFDLDDTILVYKGVADDIWRAVCASVGPRLGGRQGDEVVKAVREYRLWYWSDPGRHRQGRLAVEVARLEIAAGALARLGIDDLSLAEEMAQACAVQEKEAVRPSPGALETLNRLKSGGVRLALVTNGDGEHQRHKVDRFGLAPLFDYVLIEGEFGLGKPNPMVYTHVLRKLETRPTEAWMVGDNLEWEVAAPQRLGIFAVWVDNMGEGLPPSCPVLPDRIIRSLPELLQAPTSGH